MAESELRWRTSAASAGNECVAVAIREDDVLVRQSSDPHGAVLRFTRSEWFAFLAGVCNGEFDLDCQHALEERRALAST